MNIVIVLHESESDTDLTEVKSELSSLKIATRMHHNTLFQDRNLKNFLGRGTAPPKTPPHWGGRNPSPYPTPVHSCLDHAPVCVIDVRPYILYTE